MKNLIPILLLLGAANGCSSMAETQSGIVICPEQSAPYVRELLGREIPENREGVIALLKARDIPFEYPRIQSQSPFCDQSIVSSSVIQAFFPVSADGKPLVKFFFSAEDSLVAIEELTQHKAP